MPNAAPSKLLNDRRALSFDHLDEVALRVEHAKRTGVLDVAAAGADILGCAAVWYRGTDRLRGQLYRLPRLADQLGAAPHRAVPEDVVF